jgi:REP element-mobilizing transposase RayT
MKLLAGVANLRNQRRFRLVLRALHSASERLDTRIVEFSVQHDHVHLVVETTDARALSRAMQGLAVRLARSLNRSLGRRGKVFKERFHHRVLGTPRQVRNALAYVLCNARKHRVAPAVSGWLDPLSSASSSRAGRRAWRASQRLGSRRCLERGCCESAGDAAGCCVRITPGDLSFESAQILVATRRSARVDVGERSYTFGATPRPARAESPYLLQRTLAGHDPVSRYSCWDPCRSSDRAAALCRGARARRGRSVRPCRARRPSP